MKAAPTIGATATSIARWVKACGGTDAAARRVLGVTKATWSDYVNGKRKLPLYIARSIEAHMTLRKSDPEAFNALINLRVSSEASCD